MSGSPRASGRIVFGQGGSKQQGTLCDLAGGHVFVSFQSIFDEEETQTLLMF